LHGVAVCEAGSSSLLACHEAADSITAAATFGITVARALVSPAGVLWSISPRLVLFLAGYAFLGTFGTAVIFGRALTSLQQRILKLEADLRFGLVRLR
jgi:ABC-type uncharacterized transport system fused permease/ATPase subunit